jgi:hypothetical protein
MDGTGSLPKSMPSAPSVEVDHLGGGAVRGAQPPGQGVQPVLAPGHQRQAEAGGGELLRELGPDAG